MDINNKNGKKSKLKNSLILKENNNSSPQNKVITCTKIQKESTKSINKKKINKTNNSKIKDNNEKNKSIEDLLNKSLTRKKLDPILKNNSPLISTPLKSKIEVNTNTNISLQFQIEQLTEKIEKLAIEQNNNKFILQNSLSEINSLINTNAELLYSKNETSENNNELKLKLKNIQKKHEDSLKINKNLKATYTKMIKKLNLSSNEKLDLLQKKINEVRNENSVLNKQIKTINFETKLKSKKLFDFNINTKFSGKQHSFFDENTYFVNEGFKQKAQISQNKKLLNGCKDQLKYLIEYYDKNKDCLKNKKDILIIQKSMDNLKSDLSGDVDQIYNKIVNDNSLIMQKNSKLKKIRLKSNLIFDNNKSASMKNIKIIDNKKLNVNKSSDDIKENIRVKDENYYYENLNEYGYENLFNKKEKYLNLNIKIDNMIEHYKNYYFLKIKEIKKIINNNQNLLTNIIQENESLKKNINELKKIMDLKMKEQKLIRENNIINDNDNRMFVMDKLTDRIVPDITESNNITNEMKDEQNEIGGNIIDNNEEIIDQIKKKYNVVTKNYKENDEIFDI